MNSENFCYRALKNTIANLNKLTHFLQRVQKILQDCSNNFKEEAHQRSNHQQTRRRQSGQIVELRASIYGQFILVLHRWHQSQSRNCQKDVRTIVHRWRQLGETPIPSPIVCQYQYSVTSSFRLSVELTSKAWQGNRAQLVASKVFVSIRV